MLRTASTITLHSGLYVDENNPAVASTLHVGHIGSVKVMKAYSTAIRYVNSVSTQEDNQSGLWTPHAFAARLGSVRQASLLLPA